jgi:hypothetical protein
MAAGRHLHYEPSAPRKYFSVGCRSSQLQFHLVRCRIDIDAKHHAANSVTILYLRRSTHRRAVGVPVAACDQCAS